jgi:hypothetical protein
LWYSYYSYYYNDPNFGTTDTQTNNNAGATFNANKRNIYDNDISSSSTWGYIGEPLESTTGSAKTPFFDKIRIYGFNQHNFSMYELVNPMVESFTHDTYNYAEGNGTMENQMTFQYETVKYYEGAMDGKAASNKVLGFGDASHYDTTLSPIAKPGSNATILGQGGLVSAVGGFMDDLSGNNPNYLGALQIAGSSIQTFKNPQNILNIAKGEALSIASNSVQNTPNRNTIFNFPAADSTAIKSAFPALVGKSSPTTPSSSV